MKMKKLLSLMLAVAMFVTTALSSMITAEATMLPLKTIYADLTLEGYTNEQLSAMPLKDVLNMIECEDDGLTYTIGESLDANPEMKLVWTRYRDDNGWLISDEYRVQDTNATVDMGNIGADSTYGYDLEIIIGSGKQLDPDNVRIMVDVSVIIPSADLSYDICDYTWIETAEGQRVRSQSYAYSSSWGDYVEATLPDGTMVSTYADHVSIPNYDNVTQGSHYVGLYAYPVNISGCTEDDIEIKVYEGLDCATDITSQVFGDYSSAISGMENKGSGLKIEFNEYGYVDERYYVITCSVNGDIKDYSIVELYYYNYNPGFNPTVMDAQGDSVIAKRIFYIEDNNNETMEVTLFKGYKTTDVFYLQSYSSFDRIVEGEYTTVDEILAQPDISDAIYNGTYCADFSEGKTFTTYMTMYGFTYISTLTINVSESNIIKPADEEVVEDNSMSTKPVVYDRDPYFYIKNISTDEKYYVNEYIIDSSSYDSYYAYGYQTVFTADDIDMSKLILSVGGNQKDNVYDAVSSKKINFTEPQNYSGNKVQYTVSTGNRIRNYFVTIMNQQKGGAKLYVNGPSERTINLDSYFDYRHDILIANVGDEELTGLKVEWSKAPKNIKLHDYWTVGGENNDTLAPLTDASTKDYLAKIRLLPDGDGEISGQLKISADGQEPVFIDLSGKAGNPDIVTESPLPDGVKYVPYSAIVATNNIYDWVTPQYTISGDLPDGVSFNEDTGEIYGVPTETGEFQFLIRARFIDDEGFPTLGSTSKEFTLTILENTNDNVYEASDENYDIKTHLGEEVTEGAHDYNIEKVESTHEFSSTGEFGEFIALWLNGVKLTEGADYTCKEGSTIITISGQTLRDLEEGETNTIAAEFRVDGEVDNELKRTAQNFTIGALTEDDDVEEDDGSANPVIPPTTGPVRPEIGDSDSTGGTTGGTTSGSTDSTTDGTTDTSKDDSKVKNVIDLINKIPADVTADDADAVEAARKAYDALTAEQKKLVTNYDDLTEAEEKLEELSDEDVEDDVEDDADEEDDTDDIEFTTATFIGRVTGANGEKLSGLDIEIHSEVQTTTTDASGVFKFDEVEFGSHTLTITDADGNSASKKFELTEGSKFSVSNDEIVAQAGGLFELNLRFDGTKIEFLGDTSDDTQDEGTGSVAGSTDEENPETGVALPLILVGAAASLAATLHFGKKKESEE